MMFFNESATFSFKAYRDGEAAEGLSVSDFSFSASSSALAGLNGNGFSQITPDAVLELGKGWYSFLWTPTESSQIIVISYPDSDVEIPEIVIEAEDASNYATRRGIPSTSDLEDLASTSDLENASGEIISYAIKNLAKASDLTSARDEVLEKCKTATGFATPSDVQLSTTTEKVEVTTQTVDVSGLATSAELSSLAAGRTLADLATPDDVQLSTTTEKVEVTTQEVQVVQQTVDVSGLATLEGQNALLSKVDATPKSVWSYGTQDSRVVTAGNVGSSGGVEVDENSIAEKVWTYSTRELTQDVATPDDVQLSTTTQEVNVIQQTVDLSGIPESVWTYGGSTPESRTVTASGVTLEGDVTVDVDYDKVSDAVWTAETRTLTGYTPIMPDDVSGSCYCTRQDVERRWGIVNVHVWADLDNDNDEKKIQAQIDWAILSATSRIESDFASYIYKIPFNPVPLEVRRHAAALAGVELFNCRAMAATNDSPTIQRADNEYFEWKTKILSGVEIVGAERKD